MNMAAMALSALLCLTTTGAWAAPETPLITIESTGENASFKSGSKTFDDKVTVTFSGEGIGNDNDNWGWYTYGKSGITLTVTAAEGYTITGVKFYNNSGSAFDASAPFEAILVYDEGVVTKVNGTSIGQLGVTKIEVYGYAGTPEPPEPAGYSVSLKEGTEDASNWQGKAGEGEYQALPLEGVAAGMAVTVKYNGTKKVKSVKAVKKAAPAPAHEYVDLGLPSGLLWATCNVGADTPEAYGDYFAWGETTPKDTYTSDNYTYSDNPAILPSDHDAATANWGSDWRMPTKAEFEELYNNTTMTWTQQGGVNGWLFTANNGSGNSLFLPAAGVRLGDGELLDAGNVGSYWSSSHRGTELPNRAYYFASGSGYYSMKSAVREYGYTVRPVRVN